MSRLFALYILIIWVTVYFLLQNSKSSRRMQNGRLLSVQ